MHEINYENCLVFTQQMAKIYRNAYCCICSNPSLPPAPVTSSFYFFLCVETNNRNWSYNKRSVFHFIIGRQFLRAFSQNHQSQTMEHGGRYNLILNQSLDGMRQPRNIGGQWNHQRSGRLPFFFFSTQTCVTYKKTYMPNLRT